MTIICDINRLVESIKDEKEKADFVKKYPPSKHDWGIQMQPYCRWTNAQQGKVWRDFGIVAKLLETSADTVYTKTKNSKTLKKYFTVKSWVGKLNKETEDEKGLSKFTVQDCNEIIPIYTDWWNQAINIIYQQVVIINWSTKENRDNSLPDYEFTETQDQKLFNAVKKEFDGEEVKK